MNLSQYAKIMLFVPFLHGHFAGLAHLFKYVWQISKTPNTRTDS